MRLIFGLTHKTYLFHSVSAGGPHDKRWHFYVYKYIHVSCISLSDFSRSSFSEEGGKEREDWEEKRRKKIMVSTRRNGNLSNNSSSNPKRSSHSPESKPSSPKRPKVSLFLSLLICKTQQKKEERFVLSFIIFGFPFMGFRLISRLFGVMVG